MRQYEPIISRIQFIDEDGNPIVYAFNREALNHFIIKKDYDGQFLSVGAEIIFDGVKYEIMKVVFKLYPEMYSPILGGVSETPELTEMSQYNSNINVFLKQVN